MQKAETEADQGFDQSLRGERSHSVSTLHPTPYSGERTGTRWPPGLGPKMGQAVIHTTTQRRPKETVVSEGSQSQKRTYCMILCM